MTSVRNGTAVLSLLCGGLLAVQVHATCYDFEDGQVRGNPTKMAVAPQILSEGGKKFMRITGSAGDKQSIPSSYPHRNRSTVTLTSHYTNMPVVSDANRHQTYSARLRTNTPSPLASLFAFYQSDGTSESYGQPNGTGPAARFVVKHGQVFFETRYQNETKVDQYAMGAAASAFHTYMLKAVWSHSPSQGRLEAYVDGKLKKVVSGRDVNLGPKSNRLPMVKMGLYGDFATGVLDVDHVCVGGSGSWDPTPPPKDPPTPDLPPPPPTPPAPEPLRAPAHFRLVLQ